MYTLKQHLILSADDTQFINSLPANLPETKLTSKQKQRIDSIYHQHVAGKITMGWGRELWAEEKRVAWPSGPRTTETQAKRHVLGWLVDLEPSLTDAQAASEFYYSLTSRPALQTLLRKGYEQVIERPQPEYTFIANVRVRKPDRNANSYHDVHLLDTEGNSVVKVEKIYGYGRQYEETTKKLIAQELPELATRFPITETQYQSCVKQAVNAGVIKIIYVVHNY